MTSDGTAADWGTVKLGKVLVGGPRNGIYKPKDFHGSGTRIVNMGELFGNPRLRSVPMRRLRLSPREQASFALEAGDLLFARRSLVAEGAGKCSIVLLVEEPTVFESSIIRVRPDRTKTDGRYLFYFFRSPYGKFLLDTILRQVAVSGITGRDLVELDIPLPPLAMQTSISEVLSAMDDSIDLSQESNRTLEAIAHAIFKSWFVDFDPVRAKAEGKKPFGMDDETAALFPDSFEDSELGEIPRGWKVTEFSNCASISKDAVRPDESPDELFSYYSIPAFDADRLPVIEKGRNIKSTKLVVSDASILLSKLNPRIPRVWRPMSTDHLRSICSTEFLPITAQNGLAREYLYSLITHRRFTLEMESLVTGTSGSHQRVRPSDIMRLKVVSPPNPLMSRYGSVVLPFRRRMDVGQIMNATIANTRDALLPKLFSGKIRLPASTARQRGMSKECAQ